MLGAHEWLNKFHHWLAIYRAHENLKRSMMNVGTLVKSTLGKQTVNGVLTQKEIDVPALGPNARRATVDKFGVLSSLRINIQQARPGESNGHGNTMFWSLWSVLQARNFAFLKGFLPHFAKEQLVCSLLCAVPKSDMITDQGRRGQLAQSIRSSRLSSIRLIWLFRRDAHWQWRFRYCRLDLCPIEVGKWLCIRCNSNIQHDG